MPRGSSGQTTDLPVVGVSREEVLRRRPWASQLTIIVGEHRGGRLELEPGTRGFCFYGATLEDVDFSGMDLAHFGATGSSFVRCDFTRAVLSDNVRMSGWPQSVYEDCVFDRARMTPGSSRWLFGAGCARFVRCRFIKTTMTSWNILGADFIDCVFEGKMKSAVFNGSTPKRDPGPVNVDGQFLPGTRKLVFRGNDLSRVDLVGCALRRGVDVDANRWPAGEDYVWVENVPAAVSCARAVLTDIVDERAVARASAELDVLLFNDQARTFVRRSELERRLGAEAATTLIAALLR